MKKRFWVGLICLGALVLLAVSGLGCGGAIYGENSVVAKSPTTEFEFKSYVTFDCPSVKEALQDAVGPAPYELSQAGFDAIRNWVADNIDYKSDQERWRGDYWQTPEETLSYRTGDCEDFSILLCSLLRTYGIAAERVFVTLGVDGSDDGHAFLIDDWYCDGEWRRIESQAPAQLSSVAWLGGLRQHPDSELDKYEITVAFNDLYYHEDAEESFSWSRDQSDLSMISRIISAAGDIVRQLSRFTEYLLENLFD
jgi:Transglutaminase-like superfamily